MTHIIPLGLALIVFLFGCWLARVAHRKEREEFKSDSEYRDYSTLASGLGPGAPANNWMFWAVVMFTVAFVLALVGMKG